MVTVGNFVVILIWAALAGAVGGFLASVVPGGIGKKDVPGAPAEAGAVASTFVGAAAAVASLLLSSAFKDMVVVGEGATTAKASLTATQIVQCFGIGMIGMKWLINYQGSQTLRAALAEVAGQDEVNQEVAAKAPAAKPREVLAAAKR